MFNVNMYVEVLQLLPGLQYSCHIQGDISVDAQSQRSFHSQIQSYFFQSDMFPLIMHLIIHASLYNSSDV